MESSEQVGLSVRVSYRQPIPQAASGAVLFAFQLEETRRRWESLFNPLLPDDALRRFRDHADEVRSRRVELTPSMFVAGVTDISAPVLRGGAAAAALTVPYLERRQPVHSPAEVAEMVLATAAKIAEQLVQSDERL